MMQTRNAAAYNVSDSCRMISKLSGFFLFGEPANGISFQSVAVALRIKRGEREDLVVFVGKKRVNLERKSFLELEEREEVY